MPLGMEIDLGQGHVVLDGDPAPPTKGTQQPPVFCTLFHSELTAVKITGRRYYKPYVGYKGGSWLTWGHWVQTHLGLELGLVITWPLGHAPLSSNHRSGHAYLVIPRPYCHAHFRVRVRARVMVRVSYFVTSRPRPLIIQSPLRPLLLSDATPILPRPL